MKRQALGLSPSEQKAMVEQRAVLPLDWNTYQSVFPERYWEPGAFDAYLAEQLDQRIAQQKTQGTGQKLNVLDVGCGIKGTRALAQRVGLVNAYYHDPNLREGPEGFQCWDPKKSSATFDLMLCRGAINYLTRSEIVQLRKALKANGQWIANSFLTVPSTQWAERPCHSVVYGSGVERSRRQGQWIEHELVFSEGVVQHRFYARSEAFWRELGFEIESYGKNSCILRASG